MAATIKDVARHTGLSIATISKYLNGGNVRDENRERIAAAVAALGYKVNGMARGLKTSRTMTVGVLIPSLENIFCTSIVSGVENALQAHGYGTIICDYRQDPAEERRKLAFLAERQVDGILMMPLTGCPDLLNQVTTSGIPVVLIDRPVPEAGCDTVLVDNLNAAYAAVEALLAEGHRRIGIIVGPEGIHTARERLGGYLRVLEDYGLESEPALIRRGAYTTEGGYHETQALLSMDNPPTALFVTNYEMTLGAVMAMNERGIRMPEDLSFVGFDNQELIRVLQPAPSIVAQPIGEIAARTAQLLLRRMAGDREDFPVLQRLKTTLLLTGSVVKPRAD
jgi:DNA-binding LacI/PurR family transcriptional regulator